MKITAYIVMVLLCFVTPARAMTMADLFAALREQPVTKLDTLQAHDSALGVQAVHDRFYPVLSGVMSYEKYNSPTNLRPVTPTESALLLASDGSLPFSETISRIGVSMSMPIFTKELFSLSKQAASISDSAQVKKRISLLERQALLVGADANLMHLDSLTKALTSRKASLKKTWDDISLQVATGRLPETEKIQLDEAINQIDLTFLQTSQQESELRKNIESLTGLFLEEPAPLQVNGALDEGELFALQPLQKNIEAREFGVQAAKDKLYPAIVGTAQWFHNYGEAYNTGDDVDNEYGVLALTLQMPLFNKPAYTAIQRAKVQLRREKMSFARTKIDLEAKARNLNTTLNLLGQSKELAQNSVKHQRELLKVAKVSYASRRMAQEEYLRFEEKVLTAEANYYLTEARWWETFVSLAVLYGNNLDELIQ
ncbi:TolC family protein [Desulforhopalus sp. IMCC35007]|uniref:TolC family protein n=1 Tax=Desulforhopalus sp. IMCC35007 TaxID=2569543 RepID=UPI0010AE980E|nr:TolC family protein [Desulforhopalus sp. IMCC35007]TKB10435.1 TolC family protein [Desulforhopalus sp. IMCC35007]